ncbi:hypothetical protein F0919_18075 [Taibaiella lutea]|uniref:Uncharacterized protein n=1 Tax=Taibaiella lutea TaxID=2608001 RepID=A0A5M6CBW2_9BACT|nr:hypothetical protein [Taibaiella lutea]KAA5532688.1 hypothetical protein F0919_18075 [Taibaiella lutea]
MEKLELNGHVLNDGRLNIPLRIQLTDWLFKNKGKDVKLTVEIKRRNRSTVQNAYYWGVCVPLIQQGINDLGHNLLKEEVHEFLKKEFNLKEVELDNGHTIKVPGSTTEMTTVNFMVYVERIQFFAANMLGINIPNPNEQTTFDY